MNRVIVGCLLGWGLLLVQAAPALGCPARQALDPADLGLADLVVRGWIEELDRHPDKDAGPPKHRGRVRVRVGETWRGEERAEWVLYWSRTSSQQRGDLSVGDEIVVAAIDAARADWIHRPGERHDGGAGSDLMLILQKNCSLDFVFRTSPSEGTVAAWQRKTGQMRELMDQMPSERMRERLERMLQAHPEKRYRRQMAALRACVEEDLATCEEIWRLEFRAGRP